MPIIAGRRIMPSFPDVVLIQIFNELSYKDLCNIELVCKRWQNLIYKKFKNDVNELVVEQMGCNNIETIQNVALERLTISCPFNSQNFLSGIMRRHHSWLKRLTCDVRFLATVGNLTLKKDEKKKFFTIADTLWIVMLTCSDELFDEFAQIEEMLFLDLKHVTLQIHLLKEPVKNAIKILNLLKNRYSGLTVSLELHAEKSNLILNQLEYINSINLKSLKIICTALDQQQMQLDEISIICDKNKIFYNWLGFRDWIIITNPNILIAKHHIDTLRISSCTISNVDIFIETLQRNQQQLNCKKIILFDEIQKDKENTISQQKNEYTNVLGFKIKKVKKKNLYKNDDDDDNDNDNNTDEYIIPLKRLEVAGHCTFTNFSFLNRKSQKEFEYRILTRVNNIDLDISSLYFVI